MPSTTDVVVQMKFDATEFAAELERIANVLLEAARRVRGTDPEAAS